MRNASHRGKLMLLAVALTVGYAGLAVRLVDVQVFQHEKYAAKALNNTRRKIVRASRRGDILDIRGNVLASSLIAKTVCADPTLVGTNQLLVARTLAPLLKRGINDLASRLSRRTYVDKHGRIREDKHVVLGRRVTIQDWQQITQAMSSVSLEVDSTRLSRSQQRALNNLRYRAIFAEPVDDQVRIYPNDRLAAHALGFVGVRDPGGAQRPMVGLAGKHGVELKMDPILEGVPGWRATRINRGGLDLVHSREYNVTPRSGLNVVLTLDINIQYVVERALDNLCAKHTPAGVCAIVVNPATGAILALANRPTFNPNKPGDSTAASRRNRCITDVFEPGSTFKIVAVSGALNDGVVRLDEKFHCESGLFYHAGRPLRDHHPYGELSVMDIITKSSNIGTAKVAIKMGAPRLHRYISDLGFGHPTGVSLPGEVRGIHHSLKNWDKLSISRIPMGHGIATTPIQMVMAMSAMANGGRLMSPLLVDRLEDRDRNVVVQYRPQMVRQAIRGQTAGQMVRALTKVVSSEGTARQARLDHYQAAGKTGTAQKPSKTRRGYEDGKYFSSFIGFLPAENPKLCIGIFVDEPCNGHYGGVVAAPTFKKIGEESAKYLGIEPTVTVKTLSRDTVQDTARRGARERLSDENRAATQAAAEAVSRRNRESARRRRETRLF